MQSQCLLLAVSACVAVLAGCAHRDPAPIDDGFSYADPAVAPGSAMQADGPIKDFADADRDGFVTREEADEDEALKRAFTQYDANDDGKLDRAEFARLEADSRDRRAAGGVAATSPSTATAAPLPEERPVPIRGDSLNRTGLERAPQE